MIAEIKAKDIMKSHVLLIDNKRSVPLEALKPGDPLTSSAHSVRAECEEDGTAKEMVISNKPPIEE